MNNKSPIEDFSEELDKLYSHFSNKFILLTESLNKSEQLLHEVINSMNEKIFTKKSYDKVMSILESRLSDANNELDKIKDLSETLDKFKNVSNRIDEIYRELLSKYEKASIALNNRYLNTGSKLTQLSLANLPENNEELEQGILDALDVSGEIDESKRANVVKNMMASVNDARKGRGGSKSKKQKYVKRKKTIRRTSKK
ncbi:MAG: hypothetical protein ACOVRN_07370 [Flavobacterium sp.]